MLGQVDASAHDIAWPACRSGSHTDTFEHQVGGRAAQGTDPSAGLPACGGRDSCRGSQSRWALGSDSRQRRESGAAHWAVPEVWRAVVGCGRSAPESGPVVLPSSVQAAVVLAPGVATVPIAVRLVPAQQIEQGRRQAVSKASGAELEAGLHDGAGPSSTGGVGPTLQQHRYQRSH